MNSLRLRFFLVLLLVTITAVATVTLLVNLGTTRDFNNYVAIENAQEQAEMVGILGDVLARGDRVLAQEFTEMAGKVVHRDIYVVDGQGEVLYASSPEDVGEISPAGVQPVLVSESLMVNEKPAQILLGDPVAETLPAPELPASGVNRVEIIEEIVTVTETTSSESIQRVVSPEATFFGSLSRTFWLAAIFAVGSTAALGLVLSQRVLRPVAALTHAARGLEKGDLSRRVPISGRDEIGELARAFNAMADGLEKQERLRQRLVNDVAHELRTPLTNIRGYLEGVQDGYVTIKPAVIQSLYDETLLLNRLVDDLQELSLAEAGTLRLERQAYAVKDLVDKAVAAIVGQAQAKAIDLSIQVDELLPPVLVDGERIGQVLRNLLQNGIAYTPAGGQIIITATRNNANIIVVVQDSGSGIPEAHLPYIFERFYRGDTSRARQNGGTGLGLAIAQEWVRLHGGRIWAESDAGKGAKFTFTIPLQDG